LGLKSKYAPAVEAAASFLSLHGRGKYVKFLYNCLNEYNHDIAVTVWKNNNHRYHSVMHSAFALKLAK